MFVKGRGIVFLCTNRAVLVSIQGREVDKDQGRFRRGA